MMNTPKYRMQYFSTRKSDASSRPLLCVCRETGLRRHIEPKSGCHASHTLICDAPRLKGALASILPPGEAGRTEALWERITRTVSRWAIGAATIAVIAGTVQGGTAWILGSSYALALGVIAGFLDLIPNIGATMRL